MHICHHLKEWFLNTQRDLPWRKFPTPYAVWVSEVMLQQTQVSVVIPYFERWMLRFPTIRDLAEADIQDVLKEWEGLGYYSRARNLYSGARYVVEHYQGQLPCSYEELQQIKGLGPYTIGAILNFAFHQRIPAIDGNVLRVMARYHALEESIDKGTTQKQIHQLVEDFLPQEEFWLVTEALIELGATVCGRQPRCVECPLKGQCQAYLKGVAHQLPIRKERPPVTQLYRSVAVISNGDQVLVSRGKKGKVMQDLYEFPYFEEEVERVQAISLQQKIQVELGIETQWKKKLIDVEHSFTRYRAYLSPHYFNTQILEPPLGFEWLSLNDLDKHPFSSGHKRILIEVLTESSYVPVSVPVPVPESSYVPVTGLIKTDLQ